MMQFSITSAHCRICLENKSESMLISDSLPDGVWPSSGELKVETYMDVCKFVADISSDHAFKSIMESPSMPSQRFPRRICNECEAQLEVAYVFRCKVLQSEEMLKNFFNSFSDQGETSEQEIQIKQEEIHINSNDEVLQDESVNEEFDESHAETEHEDKVETSFLTFGAQTNLDEADSNQSSKNVSLALEPPRSKSSKSKGKSKCDFCGKMIRTGFLAKHRESHTDAAQKDSMFACNLCDRRYTSKQNLSKHKRIHSNDKRYACPHCNEKFLHWATRRYHIASRHTGEKPFVCEMCGRGFHNTSQYYTHVRRHTGLAAYACEECDRRFITLDAKKAHTLTHTDAKNFHCDMCEKSYKCNKSLRVHIRTLHHQERNYICPICKQAFSQNHVLKSHLLKNHPEYKPPPPGTIINIRALERMKEQNAIASNFSKDATRS